MATCLLLILCALICISRIRRFMIGLTCVVALFFVSGLGASLLISSLQVPQTPDVPFSKNAPNLIVVLGAKPDVVDGHILASNLMQSRVLKAAQLYNSCKNMQLQCRILTSGGNTTGLGTTESSVMKQGLVQLGIAEADIEEEQQSQNTWENAKFIAEKFKHHTLPTMILVSSALHLKRATYYFELHGLKVVPVVSAYQQVVSVLPNGQNLALADAALHEWFGIVRAKFNSAQF